MIEKIIELIKIDFSDAISKLYEVTDFEVILEKPKDKSHGDFSTNSALRLAKLCKKSPMVIASELIEQIDKDKTNILSLEVAAPGFINITLKKDVYFSLIDTIISEGESYPKIDNLEKKRILLEYVSANPTGFLHVGHARGGAYGDSLARIMKKAGYQVYREFYINDAGNQIDKLAKSIEIRYLQELGEEKTMFEEGYHGPEIIMIAKDIVKDKGDSLKNDSLDYFKDYGLKYLLEGLKNHLKNYRIEFDNWFSEKSLYEANEVDNVFEQIVKNGYTYESDGAVFAKTSDFGDEKDRVLLTSEKRYTYLVPDIAYHKTKYERNYDELINVLGSDHHGYLDRLKACVSMIGYDSSKINFELLQMVRVFQNGEEVKMSKRSGKAIGLEDLILEVGVDPIRYFFAARSLNSPMDLDLDLALRSTSENPVYYAQYAHARISSVLKLASEQGIDFSSSIGYENLNEQAKDLLLTLFEYKEVIENAASKRIPHILCNYIQKLATEFHSYYNSNKILSDDLKSTSEKLRLISATKIVLKDALNLIGVSAPDKM